MINLSLQYSSNLFSLINSFKLSSSLFNPFGFESFFVSFVLGLIFNNGVSCPAESNIANLWSFSSPYLILNPSVFTLKPLGIWYSDNFSSKKDFPLFPFPITPTIIVGSSFTLL